MMCCVEEEVVAVEAALYVLIHYLTQNYETVSGNVTRESLLSSVPKVEILTRNSHAILIGIFELTVSGVLA
jgi:hypothetical protein